jgi:uncharacterized RDD family membrane protein YckC
MAYGQPVPATTYDPTNVMGRRIAAWVIDGFLPTVAAVVIGYIVFLGAATKVAGVGSNYCANSIRPAHTACIQIGNDAYVGTSDDARKAIFAGGFVYLLGAVNLFILQGLTGAAIGKHVLGLRVVRGDGSITGFGWNALRTLLLVVDQFFCALVGLITALATHPHRRVGDFAAGTYVVAKESVGTPIASGVLSSYPPPWTPQSQPSWGPPPATWGAPAPTPGWGAPPPSESPPPAATPPPATDPATAAPSDDAPGWGAPTPSPLPDPTAQPAPQPAPQPAEPAKREPQWDAQRNAWVYWEPETNRWLQHDAATGQWGPLR